MKLLKADNISKTFAVTGGLFRHRVGSVRALRDVSFELAAGESLGLVGESGSGKTTLGKILARFLLPDQGQLQWEGRSIHDFSIHEWAVRVQMIFQDPTSSLNPKLSVYTLLKEPLQMRARLVEKKKLSHAALTGQIQEMLEAVGLPQDILFQYPHQFSGGQKQRLAIARALAMRPRLLVADEPVSALDLSIQAQILNLLADLRERFHLAVIIVSHDLAVVSHMADKVLVLKDGVAVESGDTKKILSDPQHPYTNTLLEAVPDFLR